MTGLEGFANMDVHLLYSLVNTRLRNDFADLDDLARSHDLDAKQLVACLAAAGYTYHACEAQFRLGD